MLTVELITNAAKLREFQPEWSAFTSETPPETPFQTPEWLTTWWEHFGSGDLRVLVFRCGSRVVGVMPLFHHRWNEKRQITLIGSGITDYLDPVFDPGVVPEIVDLIRCELQKWHDWDVCDWQDISSKSALISLGIAAKDTPCSYVSLEQPFEEFLDSRPTGLKRNLRRDKKKSEAAATVAFEVVETADQRLLDALIQLHTARWERAGQSGMIAANHSGEFLHDVAEVFAARGWLKLLALRFGTEVTAAICAFGYRRTIFGYLSAFDPRHEDFGFGRQLLLRALRFAHENGYCAWDFLRGDEPYKLLWGACLVEKRRVIIRR